ncbi:MAG: response regulator, partial [Acidobacteriota bacterium]
MQTILIAESSPPPPDLLERMSSQIGARVVAASSNDEARKFLSDSGAGIGAVVVDGNSSRMSGYELLEWIRRQQDLDHIEIIIRAVDTDPAEIQKGLESGAFCFLRKPCPTPQLQAVLKVALSDSDLKRNLAATILEIGDALRLMTEGTFAVRSLREAESLALGLGKICGSCPEALGLFELILNGLEHGNLGIGYQEKGRLLGEGRFEEEVERRLALAENQGKQVTVRVKRSADQVEVLIEDDGPGFDFRNFKAYDEKRTLDPHGRGILLARAMFEVEYIEPGNKVRVTV